MLGIAIKGGNCKPHAQPHQLPPPGPLITDPLPFSLNHLVLSAVNYNGFKMPIHQFSFNSLVVMIQSLAKGLDHYPTMKTGLE
jgi:hypothetical protein